MQSMHVNLHVPEKGPAQIWKFPCFGKPGRNILDTGRRYYKNARTRGNYFDTDNNLYAVLLDNVTQG